MITVRRRVVKPDNIRAMAVKKTAEKFDCDKTYVRKIIAGERENDDIKKFYNELYTKISKATAI